ncbi:MAG: hypothetical protein AB1726_17230 [Planctomycetota bacterium]
MGEEDEVTPTIDAIARTPVRSEPPLGISASEWRRPASATAGDDGGTVSNTEESEREIRGAHQMRDALRAAVRQRLESLLRLAPGWDSYGAPPISWRAVESAVRLLVSLRSHPPPSVVPTAEAGVQLEWHQGDIDIELECSPSGHAHLFAEDIGSRRQEERWVVPGHPAIDAWLRRIGAPH